MAEKFPVDKGNLSFSDDDYGNLFISQSKVSTFNTQDANSAVDFFSNLDDVPLSEPQMKVKEDLSKIGEVDDDDMCNTIFDF